jgi:hypothetical protein
MGFVDFGKGGQGMEPLLLPTCTIPKSLHTCSIVNNRKVGDPMSNEISVLAAGNGMVVVLTGQPSA